MIIAPPKLSIHLKGCLDLCFNSIMENENLETSTPAPEQLASIQARDLLVNFSQVQLVELHLLLIAYLYFAAIEERFTI